MWTSKCKTEIINRTDNELILRVGSRGVYYEVATLRAGGGKYGVKIQQDDTYRDYVLVKRTGQIRLTSLSSDDCFRYGRVIITINGQGEVDLNKENRTDVSDTKKWKFYNIFRW
jgi:hypothetical protein